MHFLFIQTKHSFYDIPWALTEMGHIVSIFEEGTFNPLEYDSPVYEDIRQRIVENTFDFVISYLFFPRISDICEQLSVDYISWTYDSPLMSLFHPAIYNHHNYTFIFDRGEYEYLRKRNVPHLYHLPLGVNLSRTGALNITPEDEANYSADISFIGSLYENNTYNASIHLFPEHLALELKTYLMKNLCNWHKVKPWPSTSPAVTDFMNQTFQAEKWNLWEMENPIYYGILVLSRKLAQMDRLTVLNTLAEHYPVQLYTDSNPEHLIGVHLKERVDYFTDMYKIFHLTKINLNITLPSIETGIPQRIFDIMGSGGFVLTNYQPEIEDIFSIGTDIEVFHDLQELLDKTAYYLSHERERLTIAMNGYKKVREKYSYIQRMTEIIRTIKEEKQ